jgi:hypothetical protein
MNFYQKNQGSTMIETVLAMSVLAVTIPLVFGALAESGKNTLSSKAETYSGWMIPISMDEIIASRRGQSQFFPATLSHEIFPLENEVWALGFSPEGKIVNKISKSTYDQGLADLDGQSIRYIVSLSSTVIEDMNHAVPMLRAKICLEYPAASPVKKREKLIFYTKIP